MHINDAQIIYNYSKQTLKYSLLIQLLPSDKLTTSNQPLGRYANWQSKDETSVKFLTITTKLEKNKHTLYLKIFDTPSC